ncbi:retrovirus-related pol polyprotein from transposon TNT 1-94 [Tanacetum coccineum]
MPLTFQPHSLRKIPSLGIMKHTKPETQDSVDKSVSGIVTVRETEPTTPSVPTEVKNTEQETKLNELTKLVQLLIDEKDSLLHDMQKGGSLDHEMCTASLKRSENYKALPYQPDNCRNYPECEIYGSYDHFNSGHNRVIHIRGGVLAESSQSSESSIGVKCNTCESTVHSTTDHNDFDHFKRETHQGAHLVPRQWMLKEKCLHLLHMDLFGPVSLMSINHEKYTLVIVDEYSRMVENQNDVKVKQIRTDNRTEFRNHKLESFCDERGITQNFSSPYTPEQNGVAESVSVSDIQIRHLKVQLGEAFVVSCALLLHHLLDETV